MTTAIVLHKKGNVDRLRSVTDLLSSTSVINRIIVIMDESSDLLESSLHQKADYLSGIHQTPLKCLTGPELSLSHKHFAAMKEIITIGETCLVFEDDVIFIPHLLDMFIGNLGNFLLLYVFVFFGTGCNLSLPGEGFIQCDPPMSKCTDSMAISPSGAQKYLQSLENEGIHLPIDWDMNYRFSKLSLNVFWYEPGITEQGSQSGVFKSSIQKTSFTLPLILYIIRNPLRLFLVLKRRLRSLY